MSSERSFTVARAAAWVPSICPSLVFATALSCTACGSGCVPWAETNPGSTNSEALVYQNESGEIVVTSAFTTSDETSWTSVRFYDQFGGRPQERPLSSLLEQIAGKAIDPQNSSYVASVTEVGFDRPMDWIRVVPRDEFRIGIEVRRGRVTELHDAPLVKARHGRTSDEPDEFIEAFARAAYALPETFRPYRFPPFTGTSCEPWFETSTTLPVVESVLHGVLLAARDGWRLRLVRGGVGGEAWFVTHRQPLRSGSTWSMSDSTFEYVSVEHGVVLARDFEVRMGEVEPARRIRGEIEVEDLLYEFDVMVVESDRLLGDCEESLVTPFPTLCCLAGEPPEEWLERPEPYVEP